MSTELVVYHVDSRTGEYIGSGFARPDPLEEMNWLIPAHAYLETPPEPESGYAVVRNGSAWEVVRDYRGVIYSTVDGQPAEHLELGLLPEGYTAIPFPGYGYKWVNEQWTPDEDVLNSRARVQGRAWRDAEIESIKWLRERHRDESDIGLAHALSNEQFKELLTYLQQLRDWPQTETFPDLKSRPQKPLWLSSQLN